jgi:putative DNA primase/helicase
MDEITNFKTAMQTAGIEPPAEIIADGKLHRFATGGKSKNVNGWYVFHLDDLAAGAFGCWKRGISETWCGKSHQTMTQAEKAAYAEKMETVRRLRDAERERIQTECRTWCDAAWAKANDATNENPYLKRKNVNAYGVKSFKDSLLIPVRDMAGTLTGAQFIAPDGSKVFKTGTDKAGHFFKIGQSKNNIVVICEGYATGASIHQATGHAVCIAFDAGNLLPVAQTIRSKFPDMKIVIAADDDHATEGNPGLTKATEAARAVNGILAVPAFPNNRGPKDSDFNDLARLSGLDAVRECIETADMPTSDAVTDTKVAPLDAVIERLAALNPLEYDRIRKAEAKALGVRTSILDAAVKGARKENHDDDLPFEEVEPWPEAVDPAELLTDISKTIRRFIVCDKEAADAVALWVSMTWLIDVVQVAPLAVITAPEKRCGKSLLLTLIGKLAARPITASNITPAALFRAIDAWNPTLLIDEADAFLKDNEELRGLLNSGHTRDTAYVIRTVGDDFKPTKFNTWGAKVIAGIGHVADTLMDRAIILELRRKLRHEKTERFRQADPGLFEDLRAKLARFADDYKDQVKQAHPPLPQDLNDRAQDNWEPLLAIAQVAGGDWLQSGTAAALKLSSGESSSQTIGTELLSDIKEIFEEKQVNRITLAELLKALCADEEKTWASFNRGFPIKPRQISKRLAEYGIKSKPVRIGNEVNKGYEKSQFEDAFARYIISEKKVVDTPLNSVTQLQSNNINILSVTERVTVTEALVTNPVNVTERKLRNRSVTEEKTHNPALLLNCNFVTEETLPRGAEIFLSEDDLQGVSL